MNLESVSKQYFSTLNALAEKIASDIQNTQEAYQHLWNALGKTEQNQVIDESIISPTAVIKYANLPAQTLKENYTYSWFTKSQLNLFTCLDLIGYSKPEKPLALPSNSDIEQTPKSTKIDSSSVKSKHEKQAKTTSGRVLKPKTPPPPPPAKVVPVPIEDNLLEGESDDKSAGDIPKTGFDFLDNW